MLKEEIEAILHGDDVLARLKNALATGDRETGDGLHQSTAIALLLELSDVQNAALLRLSEEIDRTRGTV